MKKFQDGGDSLRLPTETEWNESAESNVIDEGFPVYKPSLYDKMTAPESVIDESAPGVSGEEFMSKLGYITEGLVESKPSVDVIAPSPGFGSSQYDKNAVTEEDLYNLDEVRDSHKTTWDVIGIHESIGWLLVALAVIVVAFGLVRLTSKLIQPLKKLPLGFYRLVLVGWIVLPLLVASTGGQMDKFLFYTIIGIPTYYVVARLVVWIYEGFKMDEKKP